MTANASAVDVLSPGACDIKSTKTAGLPRTAAMVNRQTRVVKLSSRRHLVGRRSSDEYSFGEQRQSGTPVLFSPTSRSDRDDVAFDEIRQITDLIQQQIENTLQSNAVDINVHQLLLGDTNSPQRWYIDHNLDATGRRKLLNRTLKLRVVNMKRDFGAQTRQRLPFQRRQHLFPD